MVMEVYKVKKTSANIVFKNSFVALGIYATINIDWSSHIEAVKNTFVNKEWEIFRKKL
jgi:hypothetical protein